MDKKIALLLMSFITAGTIGHCAPMLEPLDGPSSGYSMLEGSRSNRGQDNNNSSSAATKFDKKTVYYPNANLKSGIAKYKAKNYVGCLQELFSLVKNQPNNAAAYYYMALAYTSLGDQASAIENYDKVLSLNPNPSLMIYATKGKDCLTGGPTCHPEQVEQDELDKFINAPYGNGLSPELNIEVKQKQLQNIQETINSKEQLEKRDLQKIQKFDNSKTESEVIDRIASASPSDQEILTAIKTLKDAGVTFAVQPAGQTAAQEAFNPASYQNQQMAEMSMMLGGGNNNNNNNNAMMNMIPFLMQQNQKGENMDPRLMEAVMMNSMMPDFSMNMNDNNR